MPQLRETGCGIVFLFGAGKKRYTGCAQLSDSRSPLVTGPDVALADDFATLGARLKLLCRAFFAELLFRLDFPAALGAVIDDFRHDRT
ncbi:MAG TPA: hypothetical protein VNL69_01720 [Bacteroidota bacterium]|nr:hypothetical protein [Bacteroidota bacterium]